MNIKKIEIISTILQPIPQEKKPKKNDEENERKVEATEKSNSNHFDEYA